MVCVTAPAAIIVACERSDRVCLGRLILKHLLSLLPYLKSLSTLTAAASHLDRRDRKKPLEFKVLRLPITLRESPTLARAFRGFPCLAPAQHSGTRFVGIGAAGTQANREAGRGMHGPSCSITTSGRCVPTSRQHLQEQNSLHASLRLPYFSQKLPFHFAARQKRV